MGSILVGSVVISLSVLGSTLSSLISSHISDRETPGALPVVAEVMLGLL